MKILILGGTGEARALAERLLGLGHAVTTSLAGRTTAPLLPGGETRIGGFGGSDGLAAFLRAGRFGRLVDATHPYAGTISRNAVRAADAAGIPLVRLLRAPWPEPEGASWLHVPDAEAAARLLPPGARVFLTTGHGGLAAFLARADCSFLVRLIEPPAFPLPAHARAVLTRPPFSLEGETAVMTAEAITHLVSKNSGGSQTAAKLDAAQRLGIPVIMIDRPAYEPATETASVEAALKAILHEEASRR